jgi:hypothetical protein
MGSSTSLAFIARVAKLGPLQTLSLEVAQVLE